jgi:hypothetical protein
MATLARAAQAVRGFRFAAMPAMPAARTQALAMTAWTEIGLMPEAYAIVLDGAVPKCTPVGDPRCAQARHSCRRR